MANIRIYKFYVFFEILFSIFYLENIVEGHYVRHSQWCHLMTEAGKYKNLSTISYHAFFKQALTVSEKLMLQICDLENLS